VTDVLPIGLAVGAALSFGIGMALEHRGASGAPSRVNAHPGLLKDLLKSSHWRLGLVVTGVGYVVQAIAFGTGRLVIIEPIMTLALVVALAAGGLIDHRPLTRHQWLVVGTTTAAVLVFTATTAPDRGISTAPTGTWVPWLAGIGASTLLVVLLSSHWVPRRRAGALALVAGCMYGITDALTKGVIDGLGRHGVHVLTTWEPYTLIAVGATAFMAQQTAYHASRLADAQPALSVTEPIVGSVIGITVLQEHVHLTTVTDFVDGVAVVVMLLGIIALGRLADRECEEVGATMERARSGAPAGGAAPAAAPGTAAAGAVVAETIRAKQAKRRTERRTDPRAGIG
jgi:drug/metabolite transporter (DMT)-like permease